MITQLNQNYPFFCDGKFVDWKFKDEINKVVTVNKGFSK